MYWPHIRTCVEYFIERLRTEQVRITVTIYVRIQKVTGSNFSLDTASRYVFIVFLSLYSRMLGLVSLNLSQSLFSELYLFTFLLHHLSISFSSVYFNVKAEKDRACTRMTDSLVQRVLHIQRLRKQSLISVAVVPLLMRIWFSRYWFFGDGTQFIIYLWLLINSLHCDITAADSEPSSVNKAAQIHSCESISYLALLYDQSLLLLNSSKMYVEWN